MDQDSRIKSLTEKVTNLEKNLQQVKAELAKLQGAPLPAQKEPKPQKKKIKKPLWRERNSVEWEFFFGGNLFGKLGLLALALTSIWMIRYAIANQWLSESVRVAGGFLLGFALILGGIKAREKSFRVLSLSLPAAGFAVFMISVGSAWFYYDFFSRGEVFFYLASLSAFLIYFALRERSQTVYLMGILGAVLVPMFVSENLNSYRSWFLYMSLLYAAHVYVRSRAPFYASTWVLSVAGWVLYLVWQGSNGAVSGFLIPQLYVLALSLFPLLAEGMSVETKKLHTRLESKSGLVFMAMQSLFGTAAMYGLWQTHFPSLTGHALIVFAILFFLIHSRMPGLGPYLIQAFSIAGLIPLVTALTFSQEGITVSFAITILAIILLLPREDAPARRGVSVTEIVALFLLFVGFISLSLAHAPKANSLFVLNAYFLMNAAAGTLCAYVFLRSESLLKQIFMGGFALLFLLVASMNEVGRLFSDASLKLLSYTIVLMTGSGLLLLAASKLNRFPVRIAGLSLMGIAILKFYAVDIWSLSAGIRILAGFALGGTLVILSIYYEKLVKTLFKTGIIISALMLLPAAFKPLFAENVSHFRFQRTLSPAEELNSRTIYGFFYEDDDIFRNSYLSDLRVFYKGKPVPWFRKAVETKTREKPAKFSVIYETTERFGKTIVLKVHNLNENEVLTKLRFMTPRFVEASAFVQIGQKPEKLHTVGFFPIVRYRGVATRELDLPQVRGEYIRVRFSKPIAWRVTGLTKQKEKSAVFFQKELKLDDDISTFPAEPDATVIEFPNPNRREINRVFLKFHEKEYSRTVEVRRSGLKAKTYRVVSVTKLTSFGDTAGGHFVNIPSGNRGPLRIKILNGTDEPLTLENMKIFSRQKEILFRLPAEYKSEPLTLYYGDPYAVPADYDIAETFDDKLPRAKFLLAAEQNNTEYSFSLFYPPASTWILRITFYLLLGAAGFLMMRFQRDTSP